MRNRSGSNERWALTGTALERLLALLDGNRDEAAARYEALHARLERLLEWWGSRQSRELADRTLDRVAQKLEEGAEVPPAALSAYVRGVARLVYYESLREHEREERARLDAPPSEPLNAGTAGALEALDDCLDSLSSADRDLILGYYGGDPGAQIETRRRIAADFALSPTALRIRAHRVRARLEECVHAALTSDDETF